MNAQYDHEWVAYNPAFSPTTPVIIDGCGHKHYRQEFRFEGEGLFGSIHAAILNWLRRNAD